ncbi:uncharacterized protein LOC116654676 [Drosophila ananassae]|uniref:uncharacterized protein LOC116654676 n=1 Tax=Drosophila ananassae TaxID=7217 RepID=UPI0013A5D290|nr:uncharacterized protein LOC116654676 [Drosophila ananassae]
MPLSVAAPAPAPALAQKPIPTPRVLLALFLLTSNPKEFRNKDSGGASTKNNLVWWRSSLQSRISRISNLQLDPAASLSVSELFQPETVDGSQEGRDGGHHMAGALQERPLTTLRMLNML